MPVTSQVSWPGVSAGSRVDVTVSISTPDAHADAEHWLAGKLIDHADHGDLSAGPRPFDFSKPGLNTIDVRIFNLGTAEIPGSVSVTLFDPNGDVIEGPIPCNAPIPPSDHFLVALVATVEAVRGGARASRGKAVRKRSTRGAKKRTKRGR